MRLGSIKADATKIAGSEIRIYPSGLHDERISEDSWECVNHSNGTSVCRNLVVDKYPKDTTTSIDTWIDFTYTGTPSPWATVTNVEAGLAAGDDKGGVNPAWRRTGLFGVVAASVGVGVALVLV